MLESYGFMGLLEDKNKINSADDTPQPPGARVATKLAKIHHITKD